MLAAAIESSYGGKDIVCVRNMLSASTLDSVYALRRRKLRQSINYFYNQTGSSVNIGEQMFLTMLNVVRSMLWGVTVKGQEISSLGAEFRHVVTDLTELIGTPNLSDFYLDLAWFDFQGVTKKMKVLAKRFDKIFESMIDQLLKDEVDAKTPLTMTELKALQMDMVIGGTDTTSKKVEFAMAEIMNRPDVLRELQQELETVMGKNNVVEKSHIQQLPYLYAVMKEALRIHPVLPLLVPHCPNPSIWENPTVFHPERFLDHTWDYSGNDFNYFPFGSGRRMCAGIAMAERMFLYSLASFIHSFDWKLPEGETLDLAEKFVIVLMKKMPLVAIPTPKLSNPTLYE
ncbi:unnamed protein product [Withania somnifera]